MPEGDGDNALRMLVEHLGNVKVAAEEAEFKLKQRIKQLEATLGEYEAQAQDYEDELDLARSTIQELKTQQSKKWRLEALDDWKALVNQLQADRKRLQGELEALRGDNERLAAELRKARVSGGEAAAPNGAGEPDGGGAVLMESSPVAVPPSRVMEELRGELSSLRRHVSLLEVQKRETEMELQKLKRQVKDALGNGHGLLGGYLVQSVLGLLGGGKKERYKKPSYTPVLSV